MMRVTPSFADHCQRIRDIKVDVIKIYTLLNIATNGVLTCSPCLKRKGIQVRPDDVWVVTHPKCGTTWTQVFLKKKTTKGIHKKQSIPHTERLLRQLQKNETHF